MCISVLFETVTYLFLCQVNSLFEFLADSSIQCLLVFFCLALFFSLFEKLSRPGILYLVEIESISLHAMIVFWHMAIDLVF